MKTPKATGDKGGGNHGRYPKHPMPSPKAPTGKVGQGMGST